MNSKKDGNIATTANTKLPSNADYKNWLGELKSKFSNVQLKAAIAVNTSLLQFYWELGQDILERQTQFAWGEGFLQRLSTDLMHDFPDIKGFSKRNLELIRQWYTYWNARDPIAQQAVSQLHSIPIKHRFCDDRQMQIGKLGL